MTDPRFLEADHSIADAIACRDAVQRCYSGLCRCGQPERYALEAAVTVYRYHHPEIPPAQAETIVSHWVAGPVRH
ncbi:hypothetical protein TSH7_27930 [Azospirillum sp. TSH7]|uniref:hypothetical protein n=1 Tax=unclassified Azospirillum TaxID=2630922 RepID=UPI000D60FB93|nr:MULTISPECIES: hypothetical protein [unclassified Azospirillum]PWC56561.1 hypothetical protein TSH7_27930 [Azospirillum sp. TSH7]PWC64982.1 hypothetical protein TSH20_17315 [Azospirillum sp. TSH20]